jgi:glycosyltransferase involved in cell wall biosynthesis
MALSSVHELWVITHKGNEDDIVAAMKQGMVPATVKFQFVGDIRLHHPNRLIARFQEWFRYIAWNRHALSPAARELSSKVNFDLVHHITYSTWRVASPLHSLGLPFIWGPVGGGEQFPRNFYSVLSPPSRLFEFVRSLSNFLSSNSAAVRETARRAAFVLASNRDTLKILKTLRGSNYGLDTLSSAFFQQPKIVRFSEASRRKPFRGQLQLFAGGNLEGRKGVALALEALAIVKSRNVPFQYTYGGYGPELVHLRSLTCRLDLEDYVSFVAGFSGEEYIERLALSHIYLLPSLRDNAGLTLMEAMLCGCVPIVLALGGPGEIVAQNSGVLIPASDRARVVNTIAEEIIRLHHDRTSLERMSLAASQRIASMYNEQSSLRRIDSIYRSVVVQSQKGNPT